MYNSSKLNSCSCCLLEHLTTGENILYLCLLGQKQRNSYDKSGVDYCSYSDSCFSMNWLKDFA